jgi:hypothetical protein
LTTELLAVDGDGKLTIAEGRKVVIDERGGRSSVRDERDGRLSAADAVVVSQPVLVIT